MQMTAGRVVLALMLLVATSTAVAAQERVLWGTLQPGPHPVGFRTAWLLDHGRIYRSTFDDGSSYGAEKAPRPILVNIWYPTVPNPRGDRMPHGDYLAVASNGPQVTSFARALSAYNRNVIAEEITGRGPDERDARTTARLERLLATLTAAIRDAPVAPGRFPAVVYHAGHGSSFEDNSVLCEYLASHGYVVLGSAFQYADGDGLGTDTRSGSVADVDALIRLAHDLSYIDWARVGFIGHSGGAQLGLAYATRPGSAVDAFVFLDTTQDYYSLADSRWQYPQEVLENRQYATAPMMFVANPHAFFALADSLSFADRYYLTQRGLGHNEFISQGLFASAFAAAGPAIDSAFSPDPEVMAGYAAVATNVRRFLDGHLRGDAAAVATLRNRFRDSVIGGPSAHVEYVPAGTTGPAPYVESTSAVPTPRQFRYVLADRGTDATVDVLERLRAAGVVTPILDEEIFATALLYELVEEERHESAVTLYRFFTGLHPNLIRQFVRWYDIFTTFGDDVTAREWLAIAALLDPTHPDVIARSRPRE